MEKLLLILLMLSILFGCINHKNASGNQGIIGEVKWLEGNLMPAIGDTSYTERAKGTPVIREIYIYKAAKPEDVVSNGGTFYKVINTEFVKKVKTKKDGTFKAKLPPGKYSIFTMEKKGLFANKFDGENFINPVTVHDNKITEIQILVNYKAFY